MGDSRAYDEWARRIAAGDWIGREVFYQAPLYPYFLARHLQHRRTGSADRSHRPGRDRFGVVCAGVSRRPAFLLAPRWSCRRVRVGSVGAGNLLRRADSEIGARCVLCVRHPVVAVKSRNRRGAVSFLATDRRGARRTGADARERTGFRRGDRPVRVVATWTISQRAAAGGRRRPRARARCGAQRVGSERRVLRHHFAIWSQLLYREPRRRGRHLFVAALWSRRARVRASGCDGTGGTRGRPPARPWRGIELLDRSSHHLHYFAAGSMAVVDRSQSPTAGERDRDGRHREPGNARGMVLAASRCSARSRISVYCCRWRCSAFGQRGAVRLRFACWPRSPSRMPSAL